MVHRSGRWFLVLVTVVGSASVAQAGGLEQKAQLAAAQVHKAVTLNRVVPQLLYRFVNSAQAINADIEKPVPPRTIYEAFSGILGVAAAQANSIARATRYAEKFVGVTGDCPAGGVYQLEGHPSPGQIYDVLVTFSACVSVVGADVQVDGPMALRLRTLAAAHFGTVQQPLVTETRLYTVPQGIERWIESYAVAGTFPRRPATEGAEQTYEYRAVADGTIISIGQFRIGNDHDRIYTSTNTLTAHDIVAKGERYYNLVSGAEDTTDTLERGQITAESDVDDGSPHASLGFDFDDLRLVNRPARNASQIRIDGKAFVRYGAQAEPSCLSGPVQVRTLAALIDNSSFFTSGRLTVDDDIQVSIDATTFPSAQMRVHHATFTFNDSFALESAGGCFH